MLYIKPSSLPYEPMALNSSCLHIYDYPDFRTNIFVNFSNTCSQEKCYYLPTMYIYVFPEFRTTKMKNICTYYLCNITGTNP